MTAKQKLECIVQYKNTKAFLERGMIDLGGAVDAMSEYWKRGLITREQLNAGIKMLAKVKTPA